MGRPEIVEKLKTLLYNNFLFTQESEIIYLLVEIRKILDRDNRREYPILRFYCDWSVHSEKDRITPSIRSIMEEIVFQISNSSTHPKIVGFIYMEDLKNEMDIFLRDYNLPNALTTIENNWLQFVALLVNVLADQPINKPCKMISSFSFLPARPGCVVGSIYFSAPIHGKMEYHFGNKY